MVDLGLCRRTAFGLAYLGIQVWLVATVGDRPDRVFGFQMFNESSSLKFELYRKVVRQDRELWLHAPDGVWDARTRSGEVRTFRWTDRVRYRPLSRPGVLSHASYGLDAQLFRLERALADVVAHIPDDAETQALAARVDFTKNGRSSGHVRLVELRP